jgi:hypothetical protein
VRTWVKVLLITLIIGIPAFLLGRVLWHTSPDLVPTAAQLPFFIALSVLEALLFGLGVAFLIYGWPMVRQAQSRGRALAMYLALGWFLVSWWPHDNFHAQNGLNPLGLLFIEYSFHVTLIIAALVLAYLFVTQGREKSPQRIAEAADTPIAE